MIEACRTCEEVRYCINGYRCMKLGMYLEYATGIEPCKRKENEKV